MISRYHHHHPPTTTITQHERGLARYSLFFSSICSRRKPFEISGTVSMDQMLFQSLKQQCQGTEDTQSIDPNHWPGFIHHQTPIRRAIACFMPAHQRTSNIRPRLNELRFYVPPDTKTGHFRDILPSQSLD